MTGLDADVGISDFDALGLAAGNWHDQGRHAEYNKEQAGKQKHFHNVSLGDHASHERGGDPLPCNCAIAGNKWLANRSLAMKASTSFKAFSGTSKVAESMMMSRGEATVLYPLGFLLGALLAFRGSGANVPDKFIVTLQLKVAHHFIERCAGGCTRSLEPPAAF
jgi:hypothetical protein